MNREVFEHGNDALVDVLAYLQKGIMGFIERRKYIDAMSQYIDSGNFGSRIRGDAYALMQQRYSNNWRHFVINFGFKNFILGKPSADPFVYIQEYVDGFNTCYSELISRGVSREYAVLLAMMFYSVDIDSVVDKKLQLQSNIILSALKSGKSLGYRPNPYPKVQSSLDTGVTTQTPKAKKPKIEYQKKTITAREIIANNFQSDDIGHLVTGMSERRIDIEIAEQIDARLKENIPDFYEKYLHECALPKNVILLLLVGLSHAEHVKYFDKIKESKIIRSYLQYKFHQPLSLARLDEWMRQFVRLAMYLDSKDWGVPAGALHPLINRAMMHMPDKMIEVFDTEFLRYVQKVRLLESEKIAKISVRSIAEGQFPEEDIGELIQFASPPQLPVEVADRISKRLNENVPDFYERYKSSTDLPKYMIFVLLVGMDHKHHEKYFVAIQKCTLIRSYLRARLQDIYRVDNLDTWVSKLIVLALSIQGRFSAVPQVVLHKMMGESIRSGGGNMVQYYETLYQEYQQSYADLKTDFSDVLTDEYLRVASSFSMPRRHCEGIKQKILEIHSLYPEFSLKLIANYVCSRPASSVKAIVQNFIQPLQELCEADSSIELPLWLSRCIDSLAYMLATLSEYKLSLKEISPKAILQVLRRMKDVSASKHKVLINEVLSSYRDVCTWLESKFTGDSRGYITSSRKLFKTFRSEHENTHMEDITMRSVFMAALIATDLYSLFGFGRQPTGSAPEFVIDKSVTLREMETNSSDLLEMNRDIATLVARYISDKEERDKVLELLDTIASERNGGTGESEALSIASDEFILDCALIIRKYPELIDSIDRYRKGYANV
jgi:hypothetical protein